VYDFIFIIFFYVNSFALNGGQVLKKKIIPALSLLIFLIPAIAFAEDVISTDISVDNTTGTVIDEQVVARFSSKLSGDLEPPSDPTALWSTTHIPGAWSAAVNVEVRWNGAADSGGSGLAGYSVLFDTSPTTVPDIPVDVPHTTDPHWTTSGVLADGGGHWFHVRACDGADHCSDGVHLGPFMVDILAPGAPSGLSSTSHSSGVPSCDRSVDMAWGAATDSGSGIDGYGWEISANSTWTCDQVKDLEESATSFTTPDLADGIWYVHLCAVDNAGNWGPVVSAGPYPTCLTSYTPTKFTDSADGVCDVTDCSLREAIIAANAAPGPDIIELAAGTYELSIADSDGGEDNGDLDITDSVFITAANAQQTIIDANQIDRVFEVASSTTGVTFRNLTITGGSKTGANGGGVSINGNAEVVIDTCILTDNHTTGGGGSLSNVGAKLHVLDSTLSNSSAETGGAIISCCDNAADLMISG
jgi:CSLREA domain-containing protein